MNIDIFKKQLRRMGFPAASSDIEYKEGTLKDIFGEIIPKAENYGEVQELPVYKKDHALYLFVGNAAHYRYSTEFTVAKAG